VAQNFGKALKIGFTSFDLSSRKRLLINLNVFV